MLVCRKGDTYHLVHPLASYDSELISGDAYTQDYTRLSAGRLCARLNYVRKLPDVDRHDSDTLCGAPSEPVMFHFGPATILMEPNRGSIEARGGGLYPPVRNIDSLCEHLRETFTGSIDRWTMTEDLFPPSSLLLSPTPLVSFRCRNTEQVRAGV